jgi:hypothetical protein
MHRPAIRLVLVSTFICLFLGSHPAKAQGTDIRGCIANLWPQPWAPPGANEKDEVESYLRDRVCHRLMTLSEAQQLIATNWYSVYLTINC